MPIKVSDIKTLFPGKWLNDQKILEYLVEEYQHKRKKKSPTATWKKLHPKNIPLQKNLNDCGVFVCTYAKYLTRNAEFDFTFKNMLNLRLQILNEIVSGLLENQVAIEFNIGKHKDSQPTQKNESFSEEIIIKTDIPEVYVVQSANFHQGSSEVFKHQRANAQCMAMSVIAILLIPTKAQNISAQLLNKILIEGDKYYIDCLNSRARAINNDHLMILQ
ncbi:uncharacterized protein LOC141525496 [Cotesia typhae]|uniref:uncharacterized protein LOC141525496 n=1 Tax=Cotesia typhae TaxID=2053667 RepID=UPI003D69D561